MPKPRVVGPPEAARHLSQGLDAIANLLAPTLGPVAGLVVNERSFNRGPELLDDSPTIVRRILSLGHPQRDIGAMLMRDLVRQVGRQVGDGGATTAVLTQAIYREALRRVSAGASPIHLAQGVTAGVAAVIDALHAQTWPVDTEDELARLALTLVGEKPLAAVLGELRYLLGAEGQVVLEEYAGPVLRRRYLDGVRLPAQIASRHLYTEPERQRATSGPGAIALCEAPLNQPEQVVALLEALQQHGAPALTIIAPGMSDAALSVLISNRRAPEPDKPLATQKGFTPAEKSAAEKKKPHLLAAQLKVEAAELSTGLADLALLTGATILGPNRQRAVIRVQPADLGSAARVELSAGHLLLVAAPQTREPVQAEVAALRRRLNSLPAQSEEAESLRRRLSLLSGGVGILQIGANSRRARQVRHNRAERALKVLAAAQRSGAAAGGGAALLHARAALDELTLPGEAAQGVRLLRQALVAPMRQLLHNARIDDPAWIVAQVAQAGPPAAYDVLAGRMVDARQTGLLDPVEVLAAVVRTAASGAMMALKTDAIVYHRHPQSDRKRSDHAPRSFPRR